MKYGLIAAAALASAVGTPALAQNAVVNGSFENGFANWLVVPGTGNDAPVVIAYNQASGYPTGAFGEAIPTDTVVGGSPDAAGNFTAYFSADAVPNTLTQLVNLVAGTTYTIGFDYYVPRNGYNNPNDATLSFLINGAQISSLTAGSASGTPVTTWQNFTTTFKATTSSPLTFQFQGRGSTAADFAVDRVFAVAAVPESATWGMMILGFGVIGAVARRRRTADGLATA